MQNKISSTIHVALQPLHQKQHEENAPNNIISYLSENLIDAYRNLWNVFYLAVEDIIDASTTTTTPEIDTEALQTQIRPIFEPREPIPFIENHYPFTDFDNTPIDPTVNIIGCA